MINLVGLGLAGRRKAVRKYMKGSGRMVSLMGLVKTIIGVILITRFRFLLRILGNRGLKGLGFILRIMGRLFLGVGLKMISIIKIIFL